MNDGQAHVTDQGWLLRRCPGSRCRRPGSAPAARPGRMSHPGPCAGEGQALLQLAEGLGAVPYGIELSEDRAAMVRESLPEGQSLAPADFLRCAISYRSFSLIWCNPPYDYATGEEGRVESQFIERAAHLLADNGVLALICPRGRGQQLPTAEFFEEHFYQISAMPFPEEVRKYKETIILGCKRKQPRKSATAGMPGTGWRSGWRPMSFTSCRRASDPGSSASRSRPIPSWPGWWPRARCGSTSNVRRTRPIIAPGRR